MCVFLLQLILQFPGKLLLLLSLDPTESLLAIINTIIHLMRMKVLGYVIQYVWAGKVHTDELSSTVTINIFNCSISSTAIL